jgi:c-di-GMP-binding flagellar brake protein YcgR
MVAEKKENSNDKEITKEQDGADQRYLPRWAVSNRVLYQLENDEKTHESSSRDISCTGACFTTPSNLPLNQKVIMKIYLSSDTPVKVEGQVIWNKSVNGGENLVGVTFSNTSQAVQDLILKHAFEIKKEDMIKYWFQGWNNKQSS